MSSPVTRFAPSPTGALHIGGARTALFNWAFARRHKGKFLLRIEDTDRARSAPDSVRSILDGLRWLGLEWDDEPVYQSARAARHREVAEKLRAQDRAFPCDAPAKRAGTASSAGPVLRFRAPRGGEALVRDQVQGEVAIAHEQLDDFVLLRADGSPTYMLSCVVDDYDMGVSHVIRGDDHLTNAARQQELCAALGWTPPHYAHLPLLHDGDGRKLSKREHGGDLAQWRQQGYLPQAVVNYLSRLGWSHGDEEVFSRAQFVRWFGLDAIGRAPARLDQARLDSLNAHYLRQTKMQTLLPLLAEFLPPCARNAAPLKRAWQALIARSHTLKDLAAAAAPLYAARPLALHEDAKQILTPAMRAQLAEFYPLLARLPQWNEEQLNAALRAFVQQSGEPMGKIAPALRAALTGQKGSLGVIVLLWALERDEALARLKEQLAQKD